MKVEHSGENTLAPGICTGAVIFTGTTQTLSVRGAGGGGACFLLFSSNTKHTSYGTAGTVGSVEMIPLIAEV